MGRQGLSRSVVLDRQEHLVIDAVVDPLRLDVFSIFNEFDLLWLSVSNAMGDGVVVVVDDLVGVFGIPEDLSSEGQDDELQRVTRDLSVEPEDQVLEQVFVVQLALFVDLLDFLVVLELLGDLIFLLLLLLQFELLG